MNETWKDVVGFEGYYKVSNLGNVKSCDRYVKCSRGLNKRLWKGKLLTKIISSTRGYEQVSLSVDGKSHKVYVHRLVAEAFLVGKHDTVNHKDGNKLNNCVDNLEWVSYSENNLHAYAMGLKSPSGGRNGRKQNKC